MLKKTLALKYEVKTNRVASTTGVNGVKTV